MRRSQQLGTKLVFTIIFLIMVGCSGSGGDTLGLEDVPLERDLTIIRTDSPGGVSLNSVWNLEVQIANIGSLDVGSFRVSAEIRNGATLVSYGQIQVSEGLLGTDARAITITMSGIRSSGAYVGTVEIDSQHIIVEVDETNNVDTFSVSAGSPLKTSG